MKRSQTAAHPSYHRVALPVLAALPCALALPLAAAEPAFAASAASNQAIERTAQATDDTNAGNTGDATGSTSPSTPTGDTTTPTDPTDSPSADGTDTAPDDQPEQTTWQAFGTCEWMIDGEGTLILRPAEGASTGKLGTPEKVTDGIAVWPWTAEHEAILAIRIEGTITPAAGASDLSGLFSQCSQLAKVSLKGLDTSQATTLAGAFHGCSSLTELDLSALNTSNVTDLSQFLSSCSALTRVTLPASFGTKATAMPELFAGCTVLSNLELPAGFGAVATDMHGMFQGCQGLGELKLPEGFGLQCTNASALFKGCVLTKQLTLPQGFGGPATNLSSFMEGAKMPAVTFPLGFGIQALDATSMMSGATINEINLPRAFGVALTKADEMFADVATATLAIPEGFGAHLTSAARMFAGSSVTTLDLSHLNLMHLAQAADMFDGCEKLAQVTLGEEFSFTGAGTQVLFTLPASVNWEKIDKSGKALGDALPADEFAAGFSEGRAGTYRAVKSEPVEVTWESTTYPGEDGASTTVNRTKDGTVLLIDRDANLAVTSITATLSSSAANSGAVTLPMRGVRPGTSAETAPSIKVGMPAGRTVALTVPVALENGSVSPSAVLAIVEGAGSDETDTDSAGTVTVMPKTGRTKEGLCLVVEGEVTLKVIDEHATFGDIVGPEWYASETAPFVNARGILTGFVHADGSVTFSGGSPTTRAMFVTMLNRLELSPQATGESTFTDVPDSVWYANTVTWGAETGLVSGFENGTFGGDAPVSREQVAVFLMRYAQMLGHDTSSRAALTQPDANQVSPWAKEAVSWAVAEGYISGDEVAGTLRPLGNASRAETAAILMRFVNALYTQGN